MTQISSAVEIAFVTIGISLIVAEQYVNYKEKRRWRKWVESYAIRAMTT